MAETISIQVIEHKKAGMLIAFSDDLPGLYVHARNHDDLDRNILVAIKDIFEAQGREGVVVTKSETDGIARSGFRSGTALYCAHLAAVA